MAAKNKGKILTTTQKGDASTIPAKWRAKLGVVQTTQKVPTDELPDTLTGGLIESATRQTQNEKNTNERDKENITLAATSGTLTEQVMTRDGQLGTRTVSFVAEGAALPTLTALTEDAQQQGFGNGFAEQQVTTVASLFPRNSVGVQQVFRLPDKFITGAMSITNTGVTSAGTTATTTSLGSGGTGVIESKAQRLDALKVRVEDVTLSGTPASSVTEYTLADGQLVTVTDSLIADDTVAPSVTATTELIERRVLGGGKAEQRVGTVAVVFDRARQGHQQVMQLPEKFFDADTTVVTSATVSAGVTATPTALGTAGVGVVKSTAQRVDATKVQLETTTITGAASSVTEYTSSQGQLVTVTDSIVADDAVPSAPTATTEMLEQRVLGGGKAERRVGVVDAVFPQTRVMEEGTAATLAREAQHFFVSFKQQTTSNVAAGTTATPTTLADPADVAALTGGVGIVASVADRVDATKVRTTDTVVTADGLGTLGGFEFDRETGLLLPTTQELVDAGTAGLALQSNGTYAEVRPLNTKFSVKTTRKATALTTRTYTISDYVGSLPRVLVVFAAVVFTDKPKRMPYQNPTTSNGKGPFLDPQYVTPGGNILHASMHIELKNYNGVYDIEVYEAWAATPHTCSADLLQGQSFSWVTPYGGGSVPECLHPEVSISYSTGTTHPVYAYISGSYTFAATTPEGLSGDIIIQDVQMPYLGGWKRVKKTITI